MINLTDGEKQALGVVSLINCLIWAENDGQLKGDDLTLEYLHYLGRQFIEEVLELDIDSFRDKIEQLGMLDDRH